MNHLQNLSLGLRKKLPVVLQTEVAECGLACLAAVAGFHGFHTDLRALRSKYRLSLKGANLADVVRFADDMGLTGRALRLELDKLGSVVSVAKTALGRQELSGLGAVSADLSQTNEPVYHVKIKPDKPTVTAYGEEKPLQIGMTLEADILHEKRRLYEWVLEPIYSMSGRL